MQMNLSPQAGHLDPNLRTPLPGETAELWGQAAPKASPQAMCGPLRRGGQSWLRTAPAAPACSGVGREGGGGVGGRGEGKGGRGGEGRSLQSAGHTACRQHHGQSTLSSQIPAQLPLPTG